MLPEAEWVAVPLSLLLAGLAGSGHCFAMCGGIAALGGQGEKPHLLWLFNGGRILSYGVIGALGAGLMALGLTQLLPATGAIVLRSAAGILLILVGLTLLGRYRLLSGLNRIGAKVWARIRPLTRPFLPLRSTSGALVLGALWGWLPCGLVYAVLPVAWSSGSATGGALAMLAFGLGTLPSMSLMALGASRLRGAFKRPGLRYFTAALILLSGTWLIVAAWFFNHTGQHLH